MAEYPPRRAIIEALLVREDLLPTREWPWTTERLHRAWDALQRERG